MFLLFEPKAKSFLYITDGDWVGYKGDFVIFRWAIFVIFQKNTHFKDILTTFCSSAEPFEGTNIANIWKPLKD